MFEMTQTQESAADVFSDMVNFYVENRKIDHDTRGFYQDMCTAVRDGDPSSLIGYIASADSHLRLIFDFWANQRMKDAAETERNAHDALFRYVRTLILSNGPDAGEKLRRFGDMVAFYIEGSGLSPKYARRYESILQAANAKDPSLIVDCSRFSVDSPLREIFNFWANQKMKEATDAEKNEHDALFAHIRSLVYSEFPARFEEHHLSQPRDRGVTLFGDMVDAFVQMNGLSDDEAAPYLLMLKVLEYPEVNFIVGSPDAAIECFLEVCAFSEIKGKAPLPDSVKESLIKSIRAAAGVSEEAVPGGLFQDVMFPEETVHQDAYECVRAETSEDRVSSATQMGDYEKLVRVIEEFTEMNEIRAKANQEAAGYILRKYGQKAAYQYRKNVAQNDEVRRVVSEEIFSMCRRVFR